MLNLKRGGEKNKMKTRTLLTITTVAIATILLTSGFGISSAHAQTSQRTQIIAKVPSTLGNYSVVFQVCAQDIIMRAPEVILSSDSEVKNVKLNKVIDANTCKTTAALIKALDDKTIKIKKVDKSKLNSMITTAENRLSTIKSKISDKNDELQTTLESLPGGSSPLKSENVKKINDITTALSELRKELKDARAEYYRLLYVLRG